MYQSQSCQLLHNSVGTTCTTNPEQIKVMALEGYSRPTCNKLCAFSHDALKRSLSTWVVHVLTHGAICHSDATKLTCQNGYVKVH